MILEWERASSAALGTAAKSGSVVLLPVGAVEQHGPHLSTGTDSVCAEQLCRAAAAKLADTIPIVLAPTQKIGFSVDHFGFPGTLSLSADVLQQVLAQTGLSILASGFTRLLLVNGHGGNDRLLYYAVRDVRGRATAPLAVAAVTYWKLAGARISEHRDSEPGGMGHACELETSLMLHFSRDQVSMNAAKKEVPESYSRYRGDDLLASGPVVAPDLFAERTNSGVSGDPTLATEPKGAVWADELADALAVFIQEFSRWKLTDPAGRFW